MTVCLDMCMCMCIYMLVCLSVSVCGCVHACVCVCQSVCLFHVYNVMCVWRCLILLCYFCSQAIENFGNLQMGEWLQLMVPIMEMVDVLNVVCM